MNRKIAGFVLGSLFSVAAVAQTPGSAGLGAQDFVNLAAQTDMTEAHLGQVAEKNAASDEVKQLAQMLVTDHTSDYSQLTAVATKAGLTVPKGLDAKHQKEIAPFEKLKGKAFDQRYLRQMLMGHEAAIAAYERESREGQNADLKAYAQQVLPTLEKHRKAVQDAKKGKPTS